MDYTKGRHPGIGHRESFYFVSIHLLFVILYSRIIKNSLVNIAFMYSNFRSGKNGVIPSQYKAKKEKIARKKKKKKKHRGSFSGRALRLLPPDCCSNWKRGTTIIIPGSATVPSFYIPVVEKPMEL